MQTLDGRFGYGSELTYDITNATLQLGKNPVLTMHGEKMPSENFINRNTNENFNESTNNENSFSELEE